MDASQASLEEDVTVYSCGDVDDTHIDSGDTISAHAKHQQRLADHWLEVRDQMLYAAVECGIPTSCATCDMCEEPAAVTCMECGPRAVYCNSCVESVHSSHSIFHTPQLWKVI